MWRITYRDSKDGSDQYEFVHASNREQALKKFKQSPIMNNGYRVFVVEVKQFDK